MPRFKNPIWLKQLAPKGSKAKAELSEGGLYRRLKPLLASSDPKPLQQLLESLTAAQLAPLGLALSAQELRLLFLQLLKTQKASLVIDKTPARFREELFEKLDLGVLKKVMQEASVEDIASWYDEEATLHTQAPQWFKNLPRTRQAKVRLFLMYPESSVGRLIQPEVFALPTDISVREALRLYRKGAQSQEGFYYIYCVNEQKQLQGVLSLKELVTAPYEQSILQQITKNPITVNALDSVDTAARLIADHDFIALPVVDQRQVLLGVINVDDILDVIQEQATQDVYAQVGLKKDDRVFSPIKSKIATRLPWMFLNLGLAALASSVVGLFEGTMQQLIVLATLKNIVAGVSGNTAIQSLTLITRGISMGDFAYIKRFKVVLNELAVGAVLGVVLGLGAAVLIFLWQKSLFVSTVIGLSMFCNSIVASLFGSLVPLGLRRLNFDPAVGSGVLVTTVTDIFSFFSFLGIANLALKALAA